MRATVKAALKLGKYGVLEVPVTVANIQACRRRGGGCMHALGGGLCCRLAGWQGKCGAFPLAGSSRGQRLRPGRRLRRAMLGRASSAMVALRAGLVIDRLELVQPGPTCR